MCHILRNCTIDWKKGEHIIYLYIYICIYTHIHIILNSGWPNGWMFNGSHKRSMHAVEKQPESVCACMCVCVGKNDNAYGISRQLFIKLLIIIF